jgi:N-acetylneuraminic acid mutarotase
MKNLSLLFIAFLLLQLTTLAQWDQLRDIPTARYFLSSCSIDGKIYVMGGTESTSSTGQSVGIMEVYDPILNSWDDTKSNMLVNRVELGACAVNGKIYVIGGASNHGGVPLATVEEYDPSSDTWTTKSVMQTARYGCAFGVIDNKIYVAGGTEDDNFTPSKRLEIYDPSTDMWDATKSDMQQALYQQQGAVLNGKFYVIGGLIGAPWTGQKTVQMYDPVTDNWTIVKSLNEGRVGHTANVVNGKIYVIGGDTQPPPLKSVEEYDPNLNTWTIIDDAPFFKNCHTSSLFENKIYLFGGSTTTIFPVATPTATVYSFDPSYLDTIHVPADYATIQEAIDAANNGNIVIADEGTYYENINYKGKAITVASWFLVDGDTNHINNTIIDGSQPSHPDSGSVVVFNSGEDTTSVLCGFTITGGTGTYDPFPVRAGGGILCSSSGAKIIHNHIKYNSCEQNSVEVDGGGVAVGPPGNTSWVILENNIISNNSILGTGGGGGGIQAIGNVKLLNNIIEYNTAESIGDDIIWGGGIFLFNLGIITNYEWFVIGNIIRHNKAIAPAGTGTNSGAGGGLAIMRESNATIKNNVITYNEVQSNAPISDCHGGGVILQNQSSTTIFSNNVVAFNKALSNSVCKGAGITVWGAGFSSNPILYNNIIHNNINGTDGGGLYIGGWGGVNSPTIMNNTITQNSAMYGGAVYSDQSHPLIINSILWNNGSEIQTNGGGVEVYYSDIEGGYAGTGNIDIDPLFRDVATDDYHLMSTDCGNNFNSPCIDAGDPTYQDSVLHCDWGLGTITCDIGAYSIAKKVVGVSDESEIIPTEYLLYQNYSNPFNPTTRIKYQVPHLTFVTLKIFNLIGEEISTLVNEEKSVGRYTVDFDATGLPSGIYFYRLQAGSFVETKKMILMK